MAAAPGKNIKKQKKPSYNVEVVYLGESIDLKRVQEDLKQYNFLNREHPLVLRLLDDQFVVLTKFGTIAFWNVGDKLRKQLVNELMPRVKSKKEHYPHTEKTKVLLGYDNDRVTFSKIYLTDLGLEKMRIISYVLSQSVALERYENEIEENLNEVGAVIENLKSLGRALLRERELLKQIGKVLAVKQVAVAHLSLFDKPEEAWESPELEVLYNQLRREYEMEDRFDILDEKINFLSDNAKMLMDFVAEKRNAFLEMIIIALFVIDLIPLFIDLVRYLAR
ncbi:MAG: RMD1 family protein [Candidatus Yanofskybacteria bacterium]|nr:RMD1 family protein [Candidatus Yanofskybacteria bacterium]